MTRTPTCGCQSDDRWLEIHGDPRCRFFIFPEPEFFWASPDVDPIDNLVFIAESSFSQPIYFAGGLFELLLFSGLLFVLYFGLRLSSQVCGVPTSWLFNRLTANQLRQTVFGNDTDGENVVQVAAVPEGCQKDYGLVSRDIEAALTDFSDKNAVRTVAAARRILGISQETQGETDVVKLLAEQMSWRELIHTSYFDVDEFAKLIAYVLHKAGLAPLSERFKADPDFEKTKQAYEKLTPLIQNAVPV
jgi:hypothetical protein